MTSGALFSTRWLWDGSHRTPIVTCSVVRAWFTVRHRTTCDLKELMPETVDEKMEEG